MTVVRFARRAGPYFWSWLVVLFLVAAPRGLEAQVPDTVPPDTAPADTVPVQGIPQPEQAQPPIAAPDTAGVDTVQVQIPPEAMARDTVPDDSLAQDSLVAVPQFPRYRRTGLSGWSTGRREWNREELLRYHSLSLLDLLRQVPGFHALRLGDFGQPVGISTLGGAGGRVRVYLDGFEIVPLGATAHDLQQIPLGDLESVRVQRRMDGLRVDLVPMRLPDPRPLSSVEAATGVYDTKLLRGMLMRGVGGKATIMAAFDQASSSGVGFDESFSFNSARASVAYALGENSGLQAEIRSENAESGAQAVPVDANRRTTLLRARSRILPYLTLDAMIGSSRRRPADRDSLDVDLSSTQGAVRAAFDPGRLWLEGEARFHSNADALGLAGTELEGRAGVLLLPWLSGEAEVRTGSVVGVGGTRGSVTGRLGPLAGMTGFATLGFGEQPLVLGRDTTVSVPVGDPGEGRSENRIEPRFSAVSASAAGLRVGVDWQLVNGNLGGAAVLLPDGVSAPFGLRGALDWGSEAVEVGEARGLEGYGSLPVPGTREYVRLDGWFTWWSELGGRPYVPEYEGRVALTGHGIFYGGDLEPSVRVEAVQRGPTQLLGEDASSVAPAYSMLDFRLEIRILDVRAFFVWDNVTNVQTAMDFAGRPLPAGRFYYGLRWTFRN
ncbi:MAG TPA: Plug domain-containing protein [Longimicrobiaceae bacterium]